MFGCGSDEIEVSKEQSAAQMKVTELGGQWTGRGAVSIDFSASRMSSQNKTISDANLAVLAEVENLEMLDLSGSPITDAGIAHIAELKKLNTINLTGTQVTAEGIKAISGLPLYQITLKNCSDEIAVQLGTIPTLKILQLDGTLLGNEGIAALAELNDLRQLTVSGAQLTNEGLATLSDLSNLISLDISNTKVTDEGLAILGGLSTLNSLGLTGTAVTQQGVTSLQQLLPDTFIDFQDLNANGNLDDPNGDVSAPPVEASNSQREFPVEAEEKKSPLDLLTGFFGDDEPQIEGGNDGGELTEPEEPEEKAGGTLGAIFRSLNPLDN